MSFNDCKISESEIQTTGVQSQPDTLTGSAADNKMVFDALPTLVIQKLNSLIDQLQQQAAAGQVGVTPFEGMTAQTLQAALEQIHADIGGNYSGADGAGKVGYTPSEGVDEDTVQAAIEAVQANLTAYIAKIKAATGAAEVGNAPIAGMTATNVQQALEELRENIDNIVSGIIPGGSITNDMLQGPVSVEKGGTGATTPQGALANLGAGVRPNLLINPFFEVNQRGQSSYGQGLTVDMWRLVTDGNGKATVANDGIIISGNTGTYCNFEVGIEEVPPGTYTESFLVDDHTKVSQIYANGSGQFNITENLISYTFEVKSELDSVYWGIQKFLSAGDLKIFGAKLEEGSTQTLAYQDDTGAWQLLPQPESDYATQLLKCQRYYYRSDMRYSAKPGYSNRYLNIPVQFPVAMRISPTVTVKSFAGTADMLSVWFSGLDAEISVIANAPDVSKDGIGAFSTGADMDLNTVYGLCIEASADL